MENAIAARPLNALAARGIGRPCRPLSDAHGYSGLYVEQRPRRARLVKLGQLEVAIVDRRPNPRYTYDPRFVVMAIDAASGNTIADSARLHPLHVNVIGKTQQKLRVRRSTFDTRSMAPPRKTEPGHRDLLKQHGIEGRIEKALIERGDELREEYQRQRKRSPARAKLTSWIEAADGTLDKLVRNCAAGDDVAKDYAVHHAHQLLSLRRTLWALRMTEGRGLKQLESPSRTYKDVEVAVQRGLLDFANALLTPPGRATPPKELPIAGIVAAVEYDRATMKKTPATWDDYRKGVEKLRVRMAKEPSAKRRVGFKLSLNATLAGREQPHATDNQSEPAPITLRDFLREWEGWYAKHHR
jgi:hypothetical protein